MSDDIDRLDAEDIADLLDIPVGVIPGDSESLTAQLWEVIFDDVQIPESIETRWEGILQGLRMGIGFL